MKTIVALVLFLGACGTPPYERPAPIYNVSTDGTVPMEDVLAACAVWSEFVTCDAEPSAGGDNPSVRIVSGPVRAQRDAYATADEANFLITVDLDALSADHVGLVFALAHEFGHQFWILEHIPGPALMAADAATTWRVPRLSDADRNAYRWWNVLPGAVAP